MGFTRDYLEAELTALGERLDGPLEAYLVGGGALAFRGLRTETKDLDVVVTDGRDLRRLCRALVGLDYRILPASSTDVGRTGATAYVENDDGFRVDGFNRVVADYATLSQEMIERSRSVVERGPLDVRALANEDVYLLKALTGRKADVADMNALLRAGVDRHVVATELDNQLGERGRDLFARR